LRSFTSDIDLILFLKKSSRRDKLAHCSTDNRTLFNSVYSWFLLIKTLLWSLYPSEAPMWVNAG
jgi:hypothetical protein